MQNGKIAVWLKTDIVSSSVRLTINCYNTKTGTLIDNILATKTSYYINGSRAYYGENHVYWVYSINSSNSTWAIDVYDVNLDGISLRSHIETTSLKRYVDFSRESSLATEIAWYIGNDSEYAYIPYYSSNSTLNKTTLRIGIIDITNETFNVISGFSWPTSANTNTWLYGVNGRNDYAYVYFGYNNTLCMSKVNYDKTYEHFDTSLALHDSTGSIMAIDHVTSDVYFLDKAVGSSNQCQTIRFIDGDISNTVTSVTYGGVNYFYIYQAANKKVLARNVNMYKSDRVLNMKIFVVDADLLTEIPITANNLYEWLQVYTHPTIGVTDVYYGYVDETNKVASQMVKYYQCSACFCDSYFNSNAGFGALHLLEHGDECVIAPVMIKVT